MTNVKNLSRVLEILGYNKTNNIYKKYFAISNCTIEIDFDKHSIKYPKGIEVNANTTTNFDSAENFVVLECVTRLLDKGYRPKDIELERTWTLGHTQKGGRADICVQDENGNTLVIIECKTYGKEYNKELKNMRTDGGQLFSYWQQERGCRWLVLYTSNSLTTKFITPLKLLIAVMTITYCCCRKKTTQLNFIKTLTRI